MSLFSRLLIATLIALIATTLVVIGKHTIGVRVAITLLDNSLYDAAYHWRPIEREKTSDVVIIGVDQRALDLIKKSTYRRGWPWPRRFWGSMLEYLTDECHPKAIVFDMLFTEDSVNPGEEGKDDDTLFGESIDRARKNGTGEPVFATLSTTGGKVEGFVPKTTKPVDLGAANVSDTAEWKIYDPKPYGFPSLALEAMKASGVRPKISVDQPFLLHFYGPHVDKEKEQTFKYVNAANVVFTAYGDSADWQISPEMFRDKYVLVGGIAAGTYDEKGTPLSARCPGVEIQATAIANMLRGDEVRPIGTGWLILITFGVSWLAAIGVELPRRGEIKIVFPIVTLALLLFIFGKLFVRSDIIWLPVAGPLIALILATIGALLWSYLGEDRQRRRLLRALSSVVSPHIAEELARDPSKLSVGGQRRNMTVMFTDIAGFTDLSESLPPEKLAPMLNFYLEEMSAIVLDESGTLDKYIGDAIMSFWNAPLSQSEHAMLACRAALRIVQREAEIQPDLQNLGVSGLMTRLGINSGEMAVGFTGSSRMMNYTVLGDAVNLASRLEGANKIYGTRIILAETTADHVRGKFVIRKLDVLRVKGKKKPMPVYELIAEGTADDSTRQMIDKYEAALADYQAQRWESAEGKLLELTASFPQDMATRTLLGRVSRFRSQPPGADWDGVYVAKEK